MQLSKRLERVANMVSKDTVVADVGCDHAYISIYLIEKGIAPRVIAMDVNKGPLQKAKENISRAGLSDVIETRLSNGIEKLEQGEANAILLAGMGGILMSDILLAKIEVTTSMKELILQPQSDIDLVRTTVMKLGFEITREDMLIDEGKYYTLMKAERAQTDFKPYENEVELVYGKYLLEKQHEVLKAYLIKEQNKLEIILASLKGQETTSRQEAYKNLKHQCELIKEAFQYYR